MGTNPVLGLLSSDNEAKLGFLPWRQFSAKLIAVIIV